MPEDKPRKIAWKPLPKQAQALERNEFEIGYGGARGGGKTDCGMAWLTFDVHHPQFRGLVLRKNAVDLADWIDRAERMFKPTRARLTTHPFPQFRWPSGAIVRLGHLNDKKSFAKYQGPGFHRILWEELELVPSEEWYEMVLSSCRTTTKDLPAQSFATFNPGGPGHWWIKKRWGLNGVPTAPITGMDKKTGRSRVFIPSTVDDNPYLMENDPAYVRFLEGLPDGMREQWRYGSWDDPDIRGAIYAKELRQAEREGKVMAVPHDPSHLVHTIWDIGIDDQTFVIFAQFVGEQIRCLLAYPNTDYGLQHYTAKCKQLTLDSNYQYGTHFFPHDIEIREYSSDEIPRSRKEVAESLLGPNVEVIRRVKVEDRIQAGRIIFPRVVFDEIGCAPLISALRNWRRDWNAEKQTYGDIIHDWASHGADAFTYLGMAYTKHGVVSKPVRKELTDRKRPGLEPDLDEAPDGGSASPFHYRG